MEHSHLALLLMLVGLALLVAEVFIPSGGIILAAALLSLGASIWYAWDAWGDSQPAAWWTYLAVLVALLPTVVIGAFYIFPRTSVGRRILLEAPSLEEVTPFSDEQEGLAGLVGHTGTTLTMLSPGGMVSVDGERLHCESEGMMIDPQQPVEVVAVRANRLVVRLVPRDKPAPGPNQRNDDVSGKPPLDFDLPQS
jgi:membrane-bound serine protease (ClpP class)